MTAPRPIDILLVEDDDDDVGLIERTLENDRVLNALVRVTDGVEAMEFLRREGKYTEAVRPDLILLDLNMPRMNGKEVLKAVQEDSNLETIPIVVFTTSDDERDVLTSYKYRANSYITKPLDIVKFREVLREIRNYWFCVVTLPPQQS
ncbi:UNVERIFIED_CONTAM: hypothetical protein GTU68_052939 [Idotea baltica]|nr:hypothetical protein [Idotea baltica]